jgi:Transcriptional Coactivator p15 (PC4)
VTAVTTHISPRLGRKTARPVERARSLLTGPVVVAQIKKNKHGGTVRVALEHFEGNNLLDIRQCYVGGDGKMRLSKKGIVLSLNRLPELAAALNKAIAVARELGLISDGAAQ